MTPTDDIPTTEEIAKVRRYECVARGHSWREVMQFGSEDPVSITCTNCGRTCKVVPNQ